jgi:hypothetical protein
MALSFVGLRHGLALLVGENFDSIDDDGLQAQTLELSWSETCEA